jgi:glutamate-1-semialdehyde 2,1-aminomutase
VTLGDGFFWISDDMVSREPLPPEIRPNAMKICAESLRALMSACSLFGASEEDRKDMFYRNAADLFGIEKRVAGLTQELYTHAKTRIPGGTQLLSKRPENMCPNQWPPYYREARGCEIWDLDGRHYYDMSTNGIGACLLGFSDPDVNAAVIRRVNLGSASTLNPADEVELADLLCGIHPWATQARFTRAGGETGSVAVRIARATTDRSVVAFCGYHGWHDWYLSANLGESDALRGHLLPGLNPLGVPRELRGTSVPFTYNNREEFRRIIETHGKNLACVVMEPCRGKDPEPGFLEFVRDEAHRAGALLIFDEVTIGFRRNFGGAHLALGVNPDMAFFAKAIGNGFPIGAVIGTREAMEGAHVSFISSTSWTEGVGPAASVASIKKLKERDVSTHVARIGGLVLSAWKSSAEKHGLPVEFDGGYPCLAHFKFNHPESEALRTLYTQLMLDRGFLAGVSIYPTLAHTDEIIGLYASAVDEVFGEIAGIIGRGDIRAALKGPVALSGFKRLLS